MSVAECQQRVSSKEFAEWLAFGRLEPRGELRADFRAALIAWAVVSAAPGKKRRPFKLSDFLLKFRSRRQPQSVEDQKKIFSMFAKTYNEVIRAGKKKGG